MAEPIIAKKPSALNIKNIEETRSKLSAAQNAKLSFSPETKEKKEFAIQSGSKLKTLRITSAPANEDVEGKKPSPLIRAVRADSELKGEVDFEPTLMLSPANARPMRRAAQFKIMHTAGVLLTAVWVGLSIGYVHSVMGWGTLAELQPHQLGGFLAGVMAPLALLWMMLAYLQRGSDIQMYANALRAELQAMIFPSEERAQAVHKDIEELCRQAVELSTASQSVMKSIHRARMGLRHEMKELVGASHKTEAHVIKITETLNERSQKLLGLTDEIEKRTGAIGEKSGEGITAWEKAADTITAKAEDIEKALAQSADGLLKSADAAKEKAASISSGLGEQATTLKKAVDDVAERLDGISTKFDGHKTSLLQATEKVESKTDALGASLEKHLQEVDAVTSRAAESMQKAGATIDTNREALVTGADKLAEQAQAIADTIKGSLTSVQDAVDTIEERGGAMSETLEKRAKTLQDTVENVSVKAREIDTIGKDSAGRLEEAMTVAVSGAESIGSAVRRAIESLSRATQQAQAQAGDLVVKTTQNITDLNTASEKNVGSIREIVSLLETSRDHIEKATTMADEQVAKLSSAVDEQVERINMAQVSLTERVENVRDALSGPLSTLVKAVQDADIKHDLIAQTLDKRVAELDDASARANDNAEKIRDMLREQAKDISTLSGQIAGHSRAINEQMLQQKSVLSEQVVKTLSEIEIVHRTLDEKSTRLAQVADQATGKIASLSGHIESRCGEVSNGTQTVIADLEKLDGKLEGRVASMKESTSTATQAVADITAALTNSAEKVEPIYRKAVEQAQDAQVRFEALRGSFDTLTNVKMEKLQTVGDVFDERLQSLKAGTDDASRILTVASDALRERVEDIDTASKAASERLHDIDRKLKGQTEDIHLTTDQALLKIETVQRAINDQFHELTTLVAEAMAQLKNAGDGFVREAGTVEERADEITEKITKAGGIAMMQSDKLRGASSETMRLTETLVTQVEKQAESLLKGAQDSLSQLKQAGEGFALRAREIEEAMKASLSTTKDYGLQLDRQADAVAEASARTADRISEAVGTLTTTADQVGNSAQTVSSQIVKARELLDDQSERLITVSKDAITAAEEAAGSFGRQSNALFKAAQEAAAQADKIREGGLRQQRESFMGAAKFVVESLHSIAVDITRMLDGEVQERTWKAYQKGDVAAFTRRLVEMGDRLPLDKVRAKFADDTEFRTYVSRYIRQFEEIYEQAVTNDHGNLLTSTFASSDIGKLYGVLCDATGRKDQTEKAMAA